MTVNKMKVLLPLGISTEAPVSLIGEELNSALSLIKMKFVFIKPYLKY